MFICRTSRLTFATWAVRLEGCARACGGSHHAEGPTTQRAPRLVLPGLRPGLGTVAMHRCDAVLALVPCAMLTLQHPCQRQISCLGTVLGSVLLPGFPGDLQPSTLLWRCTVPSAVGLEMQSDHREQPWAAVERSSSAHRNCSKTEFCLKGAQESSYVLYCL